MMNSLSFRHDHPVTGPSMVFSDDVQLTHDLNTRRTKRATISAVMPPGSPSHLEDGRYWPQIGGLPFETSDLVRRELLFTAKNEELGSGRGA
ncbi:MAG TPA: hypothetical protein VGN72_04955 [Tepidisphaeraceae bacterium]|nr:hypothetical protein [Tepidisphaeraceae bacterium]